MTSDITPRKRAEPVDDAGRAYARTAARVQVAAAVWSLWDRLRREPGVDQQWLADRLGKSKSRVSRLLKGPGNWTLDTVGDLLEAMEGRLTCVEAHSYDEIAQGLAWKAGLTRRPQTRIIVHTETMVLEDDGHTAVSASSWLKPVSVTQRMAVRGHIVGEGSVAE